MHSSFCENLFSMSAEPKVPSLLVTFAHAGKWFLQTSNSNCSLNFLQLLTKLGFFPQISPCLLNKEIKHFLQSFCRTVHNHRTHKLLNRMVCTIPHVTQTNQSVYLVNDLGRNFSCCKPWPQPQLLCNFCGQRDRQWKKKNVIPHYVQQAKDAIAKYFVEEWSLTSVSFNRKVNMVQNYQLLKVRL